MGTPTVTDAGTLLAAAATNLAGVQGAIASSGPLVEEIAEHCSTWRAASEAFLGWGDNPRVFEGRCADESDGLVESLIRAFPWITFRLAEFSYAMADGAVAWHVAVTFEAGPDLWIADPTADQFGKGLPRLVFARRAALTQYRPVPAHRRTPETYATV